MEKVVLCSLLKIFVISSMTECNVRGNNLDSESATMLAKIACEKRIMLFGIKQDQTQADFKRQNLGPVDAILIASDLRVSRSNMQELNLSENVIGPDGAKALAAFCAVSDSMTRLVLNENIIRDGAVAMASFKHKTN